MKNILFILVILFCSEMSTAQCLLTFEYDDAGNRTKRFMATINCRVGATAIVETIEPTTSEETNNKNFAGEQNSKISNEENWLVYPNPTQGGFTIKYTTKNSKEPLVTIRDINGKLIIQRKLNNGFFDISNYPAGTYVLTLQQGKSIKTARIIKNNNY